MSFAALCVNFCMIPITRVQTAALYIYICCFITFLFYPRDALHSAVFAVVRYLSVRLSITHAGIVSNG